MTTIIAVQARDKVTFGADAQVTGGTGRVANHPQMVKISKRGEYLIDRKSTRLNFSHVSESRMPSSA